VGGTGKWESVLKGEFRHGKKLTKMLKREMLDNIGRWGPRLEDVSNAPGSKI